MILGMHFATFRMAILILAILCQVYLVLRIGRAVGLSRLSGRFKAGVIVLAGAVIVLLFSVNVWLMLRPVPWAYPPTAVQVLLLYPPAIWSFGSIFSALFLALAQLVRWGVRLTARCMRNRKAPDSAPPDLARRRLLQIGAGGLAAAPIFLSGYGVAYAGRSYEIRELTLPFGHPLTVVQLSDIHAGLFMNRQEMHRFADRVIALQPDLFVLTGDYITNSIEFLPGCVEEMARVHARYGTFAILGNHERWYADVGEVKKIFRRYGMPLLVNEHRIIHTERGAFAVVGIDDFGIGGHDLESALHGLDAALPSILLSHRPEVFPQAAVHGIPLTLAGHYHGGQVKLKLPGFEFSLADLRTPYPEGLFQINDSRLYVSRGIGTTFTPVRLNVPPEITLLNLT